METESRRCQATNNRGDPCGMPPLTGGEFCWSHSPKKKAERRAARALGGYSRRTPSDTSREDVRLRDVASVQGIIERAVSDTLVQENSPRRSRALASLLTLALRAVESSDLEARISAIEAMLQRQRVRAS